MARVRGGLAGQRSLGVAPGFIADEREEHLVDDLGEGVLVGGAEAAEDFVAEQVDGEGGNSRRDVVSCFAVFGGSLEDGLHDLVSGLEHLAWRSGTRAGSAK